MKAWSKSTLVAFVSVVLAVALIQPVVAGPVEIPPGYGWVETASDPGAVLGAIVSNPHKLPVEFQERLKYAYPDDTLRVMVALDRRNAAVESFVRSNTSHLRWYGDAARFMGRVSADQAATLLNAGFVTFVEPDYPLSYSLATSTLDVHARSLANDGTGVWSYDKTGGPMGALRSDVPGLNVDQATGKGVAVAITDSGIDKTVRDFGGWDCPAGLYSPCESRITKAMSVDHIFDTGADPSANLPTTDFASGHGTHVAGIVGGNAYYSRKRQVPADITRYGADGHNFGVAPQASLVSLKNGDTLWAGLSSFGLQWILDNHEEYGIRVSSNSWGCLTGCSFAANGVVAQVSKDLYNEGVLVVFAAGNGGGSGSGNEFAGDSQSPYVLSVANYNDIDHRLNSSSSRGVASTTLADPATWTPASEGTNGVRRPDIAAPGTSIYSTANLTGGAASTVPRLSGVDDGGPVGLTIPYTPMSGTSMSTPHVAGAAALMFSACPNAAPLDVMRAFMSTATDEVIKTTGNATAQPFEVGYGALEIRAALDWLLARNCDSGNAGSGEPTPTPTPTPTATQSPTPQPTQAAQEKHFYFHSASSVNTADKLIAGATFDDVLPTFTDDSYATDVPGLGNGNGNAVYDPTWTGTVPFTINDLELDFWAKAAVDEVSAGEAAFTATVWNGATGVTLPPFTAPVDPTANASRITHRFTTMLDDAGNEVPLWIDPAGGPVSIQLAGTFLNEAGSAIFFDSVSHPSGFIAKGTGSGSPSPTPTPTPTATPTDPGGGTGGERGTYPLNPNDSLFAQQWGMDVINAPEAWQEDQATGYGIKIAVVDSGLDIGHPDFDCDKVEVLPGSDFADGDNDPTDPSDGHGTHVAGIAGACTHNGEGVVGVAPDATIMPVRATGGNGDFDKAMADGIRFATDNGAHVINLSIGPIPGESAFGPDFYPLTEEALEYARSAGVVIAAASGNFSQPTCEFPSMSRNVICVSATDRNDLKAAYSDFPVNVDRNSENPGIEAAVVAPGGQLTFCEEGIVSTFLRSKAPVCQESSGYDNLDGTSMASPHVAGIAALVYDRLAGERSEANADKVIQAIVDSAVDLGTPGYDPVFGHGRVDALAAVQAVDAIEPPPTTVGTSTSFTDGSATAGQFSDAATIAARLTDSSGSPVEGQDLTFDLTGLAGSKSWTAATNENGDASKEISLDLAPGSYSLTVRYAGQVNEFEASADLGSFVVEKEGTVVSFNEGSAASGQYSDAASVRARVTDDDGHALSGVDLVFELADGASVPATATTDADGVAGTTLTLQGGSGAYDLVARYLANDFYNTGTATRAFTIDKEDTKTVLTITGTGANRNFSAKVTELDGGTGLAGVTVQFLQNGTSVGTAVTNADGVATFASAPKYAKKAVYEAVFAANAYYLRSAHSVQEK